MKKVNWVMQGAEKGWQMEGEGAHHWDDEYDFNDGGNGPDRPISIGDRIEAVRYRYPHEGIVVGIIRDNLDEPVCYKLWTQETGFGGVDRSHFDYVSVDDVTVVKPCESSYEVLTHIGYERVDLSEGSEDLPEFGYYYNKATGDVIAW
jgi:hypothetical protein